MKLEIEKDLRIKYDDQKEYFVKDWLTRCVDLYQYLYDLIEAKKDIHGVNLDKNLLHLLDSGFDNAKQFINSSITDRNKKQLPVIKELIEASLCDYWIDLEAAWNKFKREYIHEKSKEVRFPDRYGKLEGILEFDVIHQNGVEATIESIKDELYERFENEVDYDFYQEVSRLAEHYNQVISRLRAHDRLHAFNVLFTINDKNEIEPRVENLIRYQSLFGDQIEK